MLLYALVFAYVCRIASALRNITLDDDNPAIHYYGSWLKTPRDPLNFGGHHMVTANSDAYATLNFTGIAIYFYSPLWPFHVTTAVSLDDTDSSLLDLRDHDVPFHQDGSETARSQVIWSLDDLDNAVHILNVSVGVGEDLAILDALVYTVLEAGDPSYSGLSISHTHTRTVSTSSASVIPYPTATSTSSSTKTGLSITLGLVCTIFGAIVLWAFYWYWRRRQRRLEEGSSAGSIHNVNMSEPNSRLPSYPRTHGLSSAARRNFVIMNDKPKQHSRHPPLQSARSSVSRPSARAARRAKKPLSTIPETSGDQDLEESASQGSSTGTATPDTSPSISLKNNKPDDWMDPESSEKTTIRLVTHGS